MNERNLHKQKISFQAHSDKSLIFTGINRIDAYFHKSNGAIAFNSDHFQGYHIQLKSLLLFISVLQITIRHLTLTCCPT